MCILLKLYYAKFGLSDFFFLKLLKKNLRGSVRPFPLLGNSRVKNDFFKFGYFSEFYAKSDQNKIILNFAA